MEYREWTKEERAEARAETKALCDRYEQIQDEIAALDTCMITPEWEALDAEKSKIVDALKGKGYRERRNRSTGQYYIEHAGIILR